MVETHRTDFWSLLMWAVSAEVVSKRMTVDKAEPGGDRMSASANSRHVGDGQ